jgi:hypothetical protein
MPKIVSTDEIIEHFGGGTELAKLLGCTPQNITNWGRHVPYRTAFDLVALSEGRWSIEQMPIKPTRLMLRAARASRSSAQPSTAA